MKALVFDTKLEFVSDYPKPGMKPGEAIIRVIMAGICNTDIEITRGYMNFKGIPGHEFVGVVEECPDKRWIKKRVVGEINTSCNVCDNCKRGMKTHCSNRTVMGIIGRDGAFAQYLTLPVENLHALGDSISDEEAVFVEPLAAGFEILEQIDIRPTDKVIVIGDGKLGLLVSQVLNQTGCNLLVLGKYPEKLEIIAKRGIKTHSVFDYSQGVADIVVDCSGSPQGFFKAKELVRPRGIIVMKSTFVDNISFNPASFVIDEITLIGSRCGPFKPALKALERKEIEVKSLISYVYLLEDAEKAFVHATSKSAIKILLKC